MQSCQEGCWWGPKDECCESVFLNRPLWLLPAWNSSYNLILCVDHNMAIHFCNICCEANLVGPEAQHKWVNVLFNRGPYLQNVCHLNILVDLVLFHICCENFCMLARAGLATAHRLINTVHESLDLLLTTVAYLWPVKMAAAEMADDEVLQKASRIWHTSSGVLRRCQSCHLQQWKNWGLVQRPLLQNQLLALEPKNINAQERRTNFMLHVTLNMFKPSEKSTIANTQTNNANIKNIEVKTNTEIHNTTCTLCKLTR